MTENIYVQEHLSQRNNVLRKDRTIEPLITNPIFSLLSYWDGLKHALGLQVITLLTRIAPGRCARTTLQVPAGSPTTGKL